MVKRHTRKKYRGGATIFNQINKNSVSVTPMKTTQYSQLPQQKRKQPLSRIKNNGQSVRNLTKFFEEQALHPLPIIYGHTQNNTANTAKQYVSNQKSQNKRHISRENIPLSKTNTVTEQIIRPKGQLAIIDKKQKNNNQRLIKTFKIPKSNSKPQQLQYINSKLKTATRRNNRENNIKQGENIWTMTNLQQN